MIDENRRQRRLRWSAELAWTLADQQQSGDGELVDVSLQGARVLINGPFGAKPNDVVSLESAALKVLPPRAQLRWAKRLQSHRPRYLCGVRFLDPVPDQWLAWMVEQQNRREVMQGPNLQRLASAR